MLTKTILIGILFINKIFHRSEGQIYVGLGKLAIMPDFWHLITNIAYYRFDCILGSSLI